MRKITIDSENESMVILLYIQSCYIVRGFPFYGNIGFALVEHYHRRAGDAVIVGSHGVVVGAGSQTGDEIAPLFCV